jgi:hypothetical protein
VRQSAFLHVAHLHASPSARAEIALALIFRQLYCKVCLLLCRMRVLVSRARVVLCARRCRCVWANRLASPSVRADPAHVRLFRQLLSRSCPSRSCRREVIALQTTPTPPQSPVSVRVVFTILLSDRLAFFLLSDDDDSLSSQSTEVDAAREDEPIADVNTEGMLFVFVQQHTQACSSRARFRRIN